MFCIKKMYNNNMYCIIICEKIPHVIYHRTEISLPQKCGIIKFCWYFLAKDAILVKNGPNGKKSYESVYNRVFRHKTYCKY